MNKKQEQYFTNQPTSAHDLHTINFNFAGRELIFKTDAGVFSKLRVDFGTKVLLETIHSLFIAIFKNFQTEKFSISVPVTDQSVSVSKRLSQI
nr:methyltransferase [Oenococcus oeni]